MSISITDLASTIWMNELNETSQTSIPEIAYWIRNVGIGKLNNLILTSFTIDTDTLEVLPTTSFGLDEATILIQLYMIKYFQLQSNNFLGAVGVNDVIEYDESGMLIRKLNRNELAKTWLSLKNQAGEDLKDLINGYRIARATPKSIEGQEINLISVYTPRYNRILNQGL